MANCSNAGRPYWSHSEDGGHSRRPGYDRVATGCARYQHSEADPEYESDRDASWYTVKRLRQHLDQHVCDPGPDLSADFARSRRTGQGAYRTPAGDAGKVGRQSSGRCANRHEWAGNRTGPGNVARYVKRIGGRITRRPATKGKRAV